MKPLIRILLQTVWKTHSKPNAIRRVRNRRSKTVVVTCGVLLAFFWTPITPALADMTGPVCVEDGKTLYMNGERYHAACHGGAIIRLYGIDAPELTQTCVHEGDVWRCGRQAAALLLQLTKGKIVTCTGNSRDAQNRLIAICHAGGTELNRRMVESGFALSAGPRYASEEDLAKAAFRGIWSSQFDPPDQWRKEHP